MFFYMYIRDDCTRIYIMLLFALSLSMYTFATPNVFYSSVQDRAVGDLGCKFLGRAKMFIGTI